jgi:hypothetical protein
MYGYSHYSTECTPRGILGAPAGFPVAFLFSFQAARHFFLATLFFFAAFWQLLGGLKNNLQGSSKSTLSININNIFFTFLRTLGGTFSEVK